MSTENNVEQTNLEESVKIEKQANQQANEQQEQQISLDAIIAEYSTKTREELVDELKNLINGGDFEQMRSRAPLIRNAFQALSKPEFEESQQADKLEQKTDSEEANQNAENVAAEDAQQKIIQQYRQVEKEFYDLYKQYKDKRQQYQEEQEAQKKKNLEEKQHLLEELKALLDSDKMLKEIYDDFNAIQEKWKTVGNVPHEEASNLWESYHFLMDKFYEKVRINRELRDLDLKKNLEEKLVLCEKAEELLVSEDINNSFQILQEYHKQWKEIGPVPSDKNDEVWERFKKASDAINARRKEYYEKRIGELDDNLQQKQELVNEASEINSHKRETMADWTKDTEAMNTLVEKWKTIGPVPRQYNDEVWNKFKAQKDGFFEARKEMFAHNKQVEDDNYNKKIALCERAEQISERTDFDKATKELLALQQQWKEIGYIKHSLNEQLWVRFRAACDKFFNRKSEDYMQTHKEAEENIQKKQNLIEELKAFVFSDDKIKNVEVLKDFQKRWFDVGFTPKLERQKLQQQWDEIISANKEKLQITAEEIAQKGGRLAANVTKIAGNGKNAINARIKILERQIDSFENNLGFLSNSKNADILKKEIEAKVNRLKDEKNELAKQLKKLASEKLKQTDNKSESSNNEAVKSEEKQKNEENN